MRNFGSQKKWWIEIFTNFYPPIISQCCYAFISFRVVHLPVFCPASKISNVWHSGLYVWGGGCLLPPLVVHVFQVCKILKIVSLIYSEQYILVCMLHVKSICKSIWIISDIMLRDGPIPVSVSVLIPVIIRSIDISRYQTIDWLANG